jgi:hypothetical protein
VRLENCHKHKIGKNLGGTYDLSKITLSALPVQIEENQEKS